MPVNPLTGDILGNPGHQAPDMPRREYNPGMLVGQAISLSYICMVIFREYSSRGKVYSYLVIVMAAEWTILFIWRYLMISQIKL